MNFSRACSLTHEPGSPLAACISASSHRLRPDFMIRTYHETSRADGGRYGRRVAERGDHEERRRQIADALVRAAAARGLHATGMREVAAEAGVSLRLVQYYFGTKEELMLAAMQQLATQYSERAMARLHRTIGTRHPAPPRAIIAAILTE